MNTYIQNKLDEFDDRFAIIVDEKIDGKVYPNRDYGDFYGQRDELKDFIKEMFTDYHNHIVEKIVKDVDLTDQQLQDILSLLQDTNPKE